MGEMKRAQMATEQTVTVVVLVTPFGFVVASPVDFNIDQSMGRNHQQIEGATGS